ncbi:MAG: heme-binding protein [Candidatus Korobacteraceae bacterium]
MGTTKNPPVGASGAAGPTAVPVPPRFQQGPIATALQLGALAPLVGSWQGPGFNAIWRPDNNQPPENSPIHRFLELNLTNDSFDFQVIPGVVPNRGFNTQADLSLYGLNYLQRTSDADPRPATATGYSQTAGQGLHIEPGLFVKVPGSQATQNKPTIVRMGSIPHGVTVLMQGPDPGSTPTPGGPNIPPLVPFTGYPGLQPFSALVPPPPVPPGPNPPGVGIQPIAPDGSEHNVPEINIALDTIAPSSQSTGPFPPSFQNFINDPNSVLRDAIAGQDILGTLTINLTTDTQSPDGLPTLGIGSGLESISNIPFLGIPNPDPPLPPPANQPAAAATQAGTTPNAFVYSASATFWIEWVRMPGIPPIATAVGPQPTVSAIEPFFPQPTFLQLQYSQLVILIFNNVLWPHVTVATMTLSAG